MTKLTYKGFTIKKTDDGNIAHLNPGRGMYYIVLEKIELIPTVTKTATVEFINGDEMTKKDIITKIKDKIDSKADIVIPSDPTPNTKAKDMLDSIEE